MSEALRITADFDGGNIEVIETTETTASLKIRKDTKAGWSQWFYFRCDGPVGVERTLTLTDVAATSYPDGWPGYRAVVSEDNSHWQRCDTAFDGKDLTIRYTSSSETVWFAYFAPYDLKRHDALLTKVAAAGAKHDVIGQSTEGRDISRLTFGSGPKRVWLLGRQHSGETMASWWMEGAVAKLSDASDPLTRELLSKATVCLVPLVNIDGAFHGNLRGNGAGLDLNRQWHVPPPEAPEVAAILAAMDQTGVDFMMDVHGDEAIPNVFIDGCDVDPKATPEQKAGCEAFYQALLAASPAFQTKVGYPPSFGGEGAPTICARAVPRRYDCIGMTLEMPFKDSPETPDPVQGWSPQASADLGIACLVALNAIL